MARWCRRELAVVMASVLASLVLAGCGHGASGPRSTTTASETPSTAPSQPASPIPPAAACFAPGQVAGWSIERRAAQLVVLPSLDFDVGPLTASIRAGAGGLLFLGNGTTPPHLRQQLAAAAGTGGGIDAPLVMADVEGGGVQRLAGAVQSFPWPRQLATTRSVEAVEQLAESVGRQMLDAGVTADLAPVLDLDDGPGPSATDPDGLRSFGIDPPTTSAYGIAFMAGLQRAGVLPVVKHFPGIGRSTGNTDDGPAATRAYSDLQAAGLQPFVAAIAAGAPAVMVSNASTPGLTTVPASLSPAVIGGLLRSTLGFTGLVVTDSLSAGAIGQAGYSVPQAAVAAIRAGADMVLFGSTLNPAEIALLSPTNVEVTRRAIVDAIVDATGTGDLSVEQLDGAVEHVLRAKGVTVCGH